MAEGSDTAEKAGEMGRRTKYRGFSEVKGGEAAAPQDRFCHRISFDAYILHRLFGITLVLCTLH